MKLTVTKANIQKALKAIEKAKKDLISGRHPLSRKREEEIIRKIRKDREQIWEEKFASRS